MSNFSKLCGARESCEHHILDLKKHSYTFHAWITRSDFVSKNKQTQVIAQFISKYEMYLKSNKYLRTIVVNHVHCGVKLIACVSR